MSVITKGKTFANGEQLTAGKLNQMLDAATFSASAVDNTKTTLSAGRITIAPNAITFSEVAQSFLDKIYPIGSIYTNATDNTNPATLLGFGTWEAFGTGRVIVGYDSSDPDFDTAEETGGSKTKSKTIALNELPNHKHAVPNRDCQNGYATGEGESSDQIWRNRWCDTDGFSFSTSPLTGNGVYADDGTRQTQQSMSLDVVQPYIVTYMWKRTA